MPLDANRDVRIVEVAGSNPVTSTKPVKREPWAPLQWSRFSLSAPKALTTSSATSAAMGSVRRAPTTPLSSTSKPSQTAWLILFSDRVLRSYIDVAQLTDQLDCGAHPLIVHQEQGRRSHGPLDEVRSAMLSP